jgi:hypothetical protein
VTNFCFGLTVNAETIAPFDFNLDGCFDPTVESAYDHCAHQWFFRSGDQDYFGYVQLNPNDVNLSDTLNCPLSSHSVLKPDEKAFGFNMNDVIGSIAFLGQNAQLKVRSGYAVQQAFCGNDAEPPCTPDSLGLSRMRIDLQDVSLWGITFSNTRVEMLGFTDITPGFAAPQSLFMDVTTTAFGQTIREQVSNPQRMTITATSSTLAFSGQFGAYVPLPGAGSSPVTLAIDLTGTTSSPGASCVGISHTAQIMGFEDVALWGSSQVTLVPSSRAPTQGCLALDVPGGGYRVLNSAPISTPIAGMTSKLALDFFVPTSQPNPYWLGAVQLYASCPSGNLYNGYIGQVELTGKPTGSYSTLAFPIPAAIQYVLAQQHQDCFFSIAVNTNPTPSSPTVDNLRFVP